jgi:hypothetical protein
VAIIFKFSCAESALLYDYDYYTINYYNLIYKSQLNCFTKTTEIAYNHFLLQIASSARKNRFELSLSPGFFSSAGVRISLIETKSFQQ